MGMHSGAMTPIVKDVVLVGAGHAHVGVLRNFGMKPVAGVRLTLITRQLDTPYSGMLPGHIAGLYTFDETHIDTGPLCRFAGARLYHDEAIGLDLDARRVLCRRRPPVPFDLVSLDIGSTPNTGSVPGAAAHAVPVKPIDGFLDRFAAMRARVLARGGRARIGVVGAGAGGVELMLSLERRLRRDASAAGHEASGLSFHLVTRAKEILPEFPARMRRRFAALLASRGVEVRTGAPVTEVGESRLELGDGSVLALDEILWTTQAAPARWLGETGLALDGGGFVRVAATLQSLSHAVVFAAGDVAAVEGRKLPKSGVYAVREGPVLADNLRRALAGRALAPYKPQRDALYLVSTGERHAIGTRNGLVVEGDWVWRWKDWIDRRFMRKFNELPEMSASAPPPAAGVADAAALKELSALAMRCGGCGAKVGASVLSRALAAVEPAARDDVVIGLDAPDDAAVVDSGGPKLSVHTVDYFRAFIDDPYLFGKIAAVHALGDIYAMGGEPQSALAIATVPYGLEAKVEADLAMMMAGANEVLRGEGCALVGGHTSEGAELALGFSVTGLVERAAVLRKRGLRPGDALILTKPIGTGTLLAADMRGKARGRWVDAAIAHMTASNGTAAAILRRHGAHAATDVTGFGLIGHLVEMVRASGVDARLCLAAVPLLEGARQTLAAGILSSLQPQNLRLRRAIRNLEQAAAHPLYAMLFDPQTAGGLLASVPGARAEACLADLRANGSPRVAIVGSVEPASSALEPITIEVSDEPAAARDHTRTIWASPRDRDEAQPAMEGGHVQPVL
jgi:selenide,water dikinase